MRPHQMMALSRRVGLTKVRLGLAQKVRSMLVKSRQNRWASG